MKKAFQTQNRSINDIGLLFYKINDYRITSFLVTKLEEENEFAEPELASSEPNMISTVIYAATGNYFKVFILELFQSQSKLFKIVEPY